MLEVSRLISIIYFLLHIARTWTIPQVKKVSNLKGHTERCTDTIFSPVQNLIATVSADRTAKLWDSQGSLLNTFEGHLDRLGREGHSRNVYGLAFHPDGSLAASCGFDALARVWDLRTGRSIMALEGHVKFYFYGYHLATGGEDNTCRICNLRKRKSLYIIPAHSNLVSQVKYESQEGYFLVTSSFDMTAKVWSGRDLKLVTTLSGHEVKVSSVDVSNDGQSIVTVSHDRTIKLWTSSSSDKEHAMDMD
ncbi:hypothetical protein ACFE04_027231 [Oxalis oulophora]